MSRFDLMNRQVSHWWTGGFSTCPGCQRSTSTYTDGESRWLPCRHCGEQHTISDASCPQPAPQPGKEVVLFHVIDDLKRRAEFGARPENHGRYLETHNGRDALMDAYQEALDLAMYLKQALMERSGVQE